MTPFRAYGYSRLRKIDASPSWTFGASRPPPRGVQENLPFTAALAAVTGGPQRRSGDPDPETRTPLGLIRSWGEVRSVSRASEAGFPEVSERMGRLGGAP